MSEGNDRMLTADDIPWGRYGLDIDPSVPAPDKPNSGALGVEGSPMCQMCGMYAQLAARVLDLEDERDTYRRLAQQLLQALHDVTRDRDRLRRSERHLQDAA